MLCRYAVNSQRAPFLCRKCAALWCALHRGIAVLGIETSCNDTGAAVVNEFGNILSESLHSQEEATVRHGGINPPIAKRLHEEHIDNVVKSAIKQSNIPVESLDAVACTIEPGLPLSLKVGLEYAKSLVRETGVPFIPIHHMQAHALTVRMQERVVFPFLVFLMSGGHCLLAIVRDVENFDLLGTTLHKAPGEAFDKVARRLRISSLPECRGLSFGRSLELVAERGDPAKFEKAFPHMMTKYRDCNFSFNGYKTNAIKLINDQEKLHGIEDETSIVPSASDIAASFQFGVARHMARRLQRCFIFIEQHNLLPKEAKTLVLSGGVACNTFLRRIIAEICERYGYVLKCPSPKLCTDNGIMIAWNGMEKLLAGFSPTHDVDAVDFKAKSPIGRSLIDKVIEANIKPPRLKLKPPEKIAASS